MTQEHDPAAVAMEAFLKLPEAIKARLGGDEFYQGTLEPLVDGNLDLPAEKAVIAAVVSHLLENLDLPEKKQRRTGFIIDDRPWLKSLKWALQCDTDLQ